MPTSDLPDKTPPWHTYCGCPACRRGNALGEKAVRLVELRLSNNSKPVEVPRG